MAGRFPLGEFARLRKHDGTSFRHGTATTAGACGASTSPTVRTGGQRDRDFNLAATRLRAKGAGQEWLNGRSIEQAAEDEWQLKVQRLALEVLHVYKAPTPPVETARPSGPTEPETPG